MIYSRHNTPEEMIKRGIKLILLGFIVNIGESILPYFLSSHLLNNPAMFEIYNGLMLFYVDVFAFALLHPFAVAPLEGRIRVVYYRSPLVVGRSVF